MRVTKLCLRTLGANGPAARCLTTKRLFVGERERERERKSVVSQLDREALLIRGRICLLGPLSSDAHHTHAGNDALFISSYFSAKTDSRQTVRQIVLCLPGLCHHPSGPNN